MKWTPDMIAGAYDFLRTTMPFKKWKLPEADDIEFHITAHKDRRGHCQDCNTHHLIGISVASVEFTNTLMRTMAHEMIHVYLDRKKVKGAHGKDFERLAALVCKHHGFDPKEF